MPNIMQYWRNQWSRAANHSKATDTSKLFRAPEVESRLNAGHYYKKDGTWLLTIDKSEDVYIYVKNTESKILSFEQIVDQVYPGQMQNNQQINYLDFSSSFTNEDFVKLEISNTELNQRAFWVFNECRGSDYKIGINDEIYNNVGSFGNDIINMTVAEVYANAVQNAVDKKNGSWKSVYTGSYISRGNGNTGIAMMNGTGGNDYTQLLVNDYKKNGDRAFNFHTVEDKNANHARAAVISSVISHKELGGVEHWLGAFDAFKYCDENVKLDARTKTAQFTLKYEKENSTFCHTWYNWNNTQN